MAQLSDRNVGKVLDILEEVMIVGVASIQTYSLLHIYGQERMTKGIWRDVLERWEKLSEEKGYDIAPELLIAYETGAHNVCFACGKTVDPKTKEETPFLFPASAFLSSVEASIQSA
jgi:hypothetical protein